MLRPPRAAISGLAAGFAIIASQAATGMARAQSMQFSRATGWQAEVSRAPAPIKATRLGFAAERGRTTLKIALSGPVASDVFTLGDPYRVVVDLPGVVFATPDSGTNKPVGLVETYRYGLFGAGRGRVVIHTKGPVKVVGSASQPSSSSRGVELTIELAATTKAGFGRGSGARRGQTEIAKSPPRSEVPSPVPGPREQPVIVIDPGHGGIDPGAVGRGRKLEKNIVLAVAKRLRDKLAKQKRYEVRLTREGDEFVSLDQRVEISRNAGADLFISLHADSLPDVPSSRSVRGASVYTLSERASDAQARALAEKENASDIRAGLRPDRKASRGQVRDILIDLMKRETEAFAATFSGALVKRLKGTITMSRNPKKSAAFKVLRQTQSPSVLVELGYLSNVTDEKLLASKAWQTKVAAAIAKAIDAYFAQRTAIAR